MRTIDPTSLLCSMLGYASQEIATHQFAPAVDMAPFIAADWLVPVARPTIVRCEVCDDNHYAEVVDIDGQLHGVCMRTGEAFVVIQTTRKYRIDGLAVARTLASALQLDGEAYSTNGYTTLWTLGARRLGDTRVKFFLTPDFVDMDTATLLVDMVAQQSGAMKSALIVASDRLGHVRLLDRRIRIIRLADIAKLKPGPRFSIDTAQLTSAIVPEAASEARRPGRPSEQRDRIMPILDELEAEGVTIDPSNKICRVIQDYFRRRHGESSVPVNNTIRAAIACRKRGLSDE